MSKNVKYKELNILGNLKEFDNFAVFQLNLNTLFRDLTTYSSNKSKELSEAFDNLIKAIDKTDFYKSYESKNGKTNHLLNFKVFTATAGGKYVTLNDYQPNQQQEQKPKQEQKQEQDYGLPF